MTTPYSGTAQTALVAVSTVDDNDGISAAAVSVPLEQLADRTKTLVEKVTTFTADGTFTKDPLANWVTFIVVAKGGDGVNGGGGSGEVVMCEFPTAQVPDTLFVNLNAAIAGYGTGASIGRDTEPKFMLFAAPGADGASNGGAGGGPSPGTGGTTASPGNPGARGLRSSGGGGVGGTGTVGGAGAPGSFGGYGGAGGATSSAGAPGLGYGAGGGGASSGTGGGGGGAGGYGSSAIAAGTTGATGIVIVIERRTV